MVCNMHTFHGLQTTVVSRHGTGHQPGQVQLDVYRSTDAHIHLAADFVYNTVHTWCSCLSFQSIKCSWIFLPACIFPDSICACRQDRGRQDRVADFVRRPLLALGAFCFRCVFAGPEHGRGCMTVSHVRHVLSALPSRLVNPATILTHQDTLVHMLNAYPKDVIIAPTWTKGVPCACAAPPSAETAVHWPSMHATFSRDCCALAQHACYIQPTAGALMSKPRHLKSTLRYCA